MYFIRHLRARQAFSLVEAMVVLAIMSIIGVVFGQMMFSQVSQQRQVRVKDAQMTLMRRVNSVASSPSAILASSKATCVSGGSGCTTTSGGGSSGGTGGGSTETGSTTTPGSGAN